MSKQIYTEAQFQKAIELRQSGVTIVDIATQTGIKVPSLKKLFKERNVKLSAEQYESNVHCRWNDYNPIQDGKKKCGDCQQWLLLELFYVHKQSASGLTTYCKECYAKQYAENPEVKRAYQREYKQQNPEKVKASAQKLYEANKEDVIIASLAWAEANPERRKEISRKSGKKHQGRKNARTAERRAMQIQATPKWISDEERKAITEMYKNCPKGFHVDHIIPLRSDIVCGLHCLINLQYLPAIENMSKGNKLIQD